MARIEGVAPKRANAFVRFAYWMARKQFKKVPEPMTVMAHSGPVFGAYTLFEALLPNAKSLPPVAAALAEIRTATLVGCPF